MHSFLLQIFLFIGVYKYTCLCNDVTIGCLYVTFLVSILRSLLNAKHFSVYYVCLRISSCFLTLLKNTLRLFLFKILNQIGAVND